MGVWMYAWVHTLHESYLRLREELFQYYEDVREDPTVVEVLVWARRGLGLVVKHLEVLRWSATYCVVVHEKVVLVPASSRSITDHPHGTATHRGYPCFSRSQPLLPPGTESL